MSSPDRSFDNDHTITAYGDISQSEINFVPSAPSETFPTPTRQKKTYRRNAKKPLPPSIKKNLLLRVQDEDFDDDSVAKQAQKAAVSRPELDFEALVANLREFRDQLAEDRPAVPYLKLMEGRVYAPHPPRQSVEKGVEVNEEYKVEKVMVVKKKGPAKPIPSLWKSAKPPTSADKEANPPSSQKISRSPKVPARRSTPKATIAAVGLGGFRGFRCYSGGQELKVEIVPLDLIVIDSPYSVHLPRPIRCI